MSMSIVPMVKPALLKDVIDILGPPDRVYLKANYQDPEPVGKAKIVEEGVVPDSVHASQDITADKTPVEVVLKIYQRDYDEFQAMFNPGATAGNWESRVSLKELVWFKHDIKNGVIQGDREHYYFTFDRYSLKGRINLDAEPELSARLLDLSRKQGLKIPINIS